MLQNRPTDSTDMLCPQVETLALYSQGMLSEESYTTISQHITNCPRCCSRLDWYRLQQRSVKEPLKRGPEHLADLAKSLFMRSLYRPKKTIIQSHLSFDSRYAVTANVRGSLRENRRLLFKVADGVEIDIEIMKSRAVISLHGQVYAGASNLHIGLYRGDHLEQSVYTNSLDEFSFRNIRSADTLQIGLEQGVAVLELPRDIFSS